MKWHSIRQQPRERDTLPETWAGAGTDGSCSAACLWGGFREVSSRSKGLLSVGAGRLKLPAPEKLRSWARWTSEAALEM